MRFSVRDRMERLSVYAWAFCAALLFWLLESLMESSSSPAVTWVDSLVPRDPVELWTRILVGAVIIALVLEFKGRSRKTRNLEDQLSCEQRGTNS